MTNMQDFPLALLMNCANVERNMSLIGISMLAGKFEEMVENQDEQLAAGDPTSEIPLLWRALAETVGLTVDNAGRIVDGPRASVPGLGTVTAYPDSCGFSTWNLDLGTADASQSGEQTWTPQ